MAVELLIPFGRVHISHYLLCGEKEDFYSIQHLYLLLENQRILHIFSFFFRVLM